MVRLREIGRLELVVEMVGGGCILRGADGAEGGCQSVRVGLVLVHGGAEGGCGRVVRSAVPVEASEI
jgi:hypothetical protein